jgi:chromosomal replication initiation ATPase DnaA
LQLFLPLRHEVDFSVHKWVVGPENQQATQVVQQWPQWSCPFVCVYGPKGSGKSHLAHMWAHGANALILDPATCDQSMPRAYVAKAYMLDNASTLQSQEWLFHFYNKVMEEGSFCLFTALVPPSQWPFTLPDLMSRLKTVPVAQLCPMDDDLLKRILQKQFYDQGFFVPDNVFRYMLNNMERSLEGLQVFTSFLIKQANHEGKKITLSFVKRVLGEFFLENGT